MSTMVTLAISWILALIIGVIIGNIAWKHIVEPFLDKKGW